LYFSERKECEATLFENFRRKSKVVQKNEREKMKDEKKRTGILRVFGPLFRWLLCSCTFLPYWCNTHCRPRSWAISSI